jgi:hypothetical protein
MAPRFAPGARLSILDVSVIIVAAVASVVLGNVVWWWGVGLAFVVLHFFLFCNIVRMARPLELVWSAIFTSLAAMTVTMNAPSPLATFGMSLLVTPIVVAIEMRKPSYHGIGWQAINPNLPNWWNNHIVVSPPVSTDSVAS